MRNLEEDIKVLVCCLEEKQKIIQKLLQSPPSPHSSLLSSLSYSPSCAYLELCLASLASPSCSISPSSNNTSTSNNNTSMSNTMPNTTLVTTNKSFIIKL